MRIPSGKIDQAVYFLALDPLTQAEKTGLTSFTVYRSRNGGAAVLYTTPTVTEISAANMPGVYTLLIDEDTTIAASSDSEEMALYITQASMAPVTKTFELYRRETTSGNTLLVDSNGRVDVIKVAGTTQTAKDLGASTTQTGDAFARLGAPAGASVSADVAAINAKTTNLPAAPADESLIIAATTALATSIAALPTANANADALLDRSAGIETGWTLRQSMRIMLSVLAGKASGLTSSAPTFRDVGDSKNRVVATIDTNGDRSAVTLNAS
jgi:hypothetical protein